ncbi:MAG: lycopene cyclase domain-containing protein [Bacteroidota bacterium]
MTYLQFHLVFIAPPLVALALAQPRGMGRWWPVPAMCITAFVWTTPWDNYLVANEIWTYPPGRVLATIGYVPVEEYAFFLLQPILTGLWYRIVRARRALGPGTPSRTPHVVGAAVFGALTLLGAVLWARGGHGLYLGLIVAWACPILAGMWWLDGARLAARWRLLAVAGVPPTLYLWAADWYAITQAGIWHITDATRTGWELAGLPMEEALFFAVTNLLVVQGLTMLEPDDVPVYIRRD